MQNKKGFTLIELLVVVAIIGLLSTLGVIAFRDAQKKGRDTKRMGDVKAVINGFATAGQEGKYLCDSSCAAIATLPAKISTLGICDSNCAGGTNINSQFVNLAALNDPLKNKPGDNACTATAADCNYSIDKGDDGNGPTLSNYQIYFYTEIKQASLGDTTAHKANQNGIVN